MSILLKEGDSGNNVKEIQIALNLSPDGKFGPYTKAAVQRYQAKNGLTPDGIVGAKTWSLLIKIAIDTDTDRFGYDDSKPDTDNKLEKLGTYETEDGLEIDRLYLDSDEYVRDYGEVEPVNLIIHHTAGWDNPRNTVNSWNRDKRGRIATQYVVGGSNIKGESNHDGEVIECFPNNYLGWHVGKVSNFEKVSKLSVGIELCNFGYVSLNDSDGKFYNYVNVEVPADQVCDLGYAFRGHRYWHKYSDAQLANLSLLIKHVAKTYPKINIQMGLPHILKQGTHPQKAFGFNSDADKGVTTGTWTHTSIRRDKFDCSPQPNLIELLKNI